MTLTALKSAVAAVMNKTVADFTVDSQDIFLVAVNQARRNAELLHDFEFSRKLVTVSVDGVTGGSLSSAVQYGTATVVDIKSVIEMGLFDQEANLVPAEWTTVAEGLERQRADNPFTAPRYPTDGWYESTPMGMGRFQLAGGTIYRFPKDSTADYTVGMEVYSFKEDWDATDLGSTATVTGTISPNFTGDYDVVGTYNNCPFFYDDGGAYWLFYDGDAWILGPEFPMLGSPPAGYFKLTTTSQSPAGSYTAQGTATGTAVVALSGFVEDEWLKYGYQHLLWATVVILNHRFKTFVYRQEGNLPPPDKQAEAGLAAFIEWDAARYETNRRHGR